MKVLVMGGSYFIGRRIVDKLYEKGYEVYVLNRGSRAIENSDIHSIICDRNDKETMNHILSTYNFDIVVDVCGLNEDQAEILCSSLDFDSVKKFVFISSSAVYDIEHLNIPFAEDDALGADSFWQEYGTDKIEAERYYTESLKNKDTELIILRPPYVYGENNYAQRESFIFDHIVKNQPILIPKSNPKLQFIYTSDLAEIIIEFISRQNDKVSIYNVGNKTAVTVEQWIKHCFNVVQKSTEIIKYDYKAAGRNVRDFFPFHDYDNVLDVRKIKSIVSSETDFYYGLKKAYVWYLKERENIKFKESVSENERLILKEIRWNKNN